MLYSHATGLLVSQYEREAPPRRTRSLYVRDATTFEYERITPPDDATSYESPVVARSRPFVFFSVMVISERGGGNWLHVSRGHLITKADHSSVLLVVGRGECGDRIGGRAKFGEAA